MWGLGNAALLALLGSSTPVAAGGLIGYGIQMYQPNCAFACRSSFASAMLKCSDHSHVPSAGHSHGPGATSPECRSQDEDWLTTLAYCINATCDDQVASWTLEKYWADQNTGDPAVLPKWTLQQTLQQMESRDPPTKELDEEAMLESTVLFNKDTWESYRGTLWAFENAETNHSRYDIILIVLTIASPILISLLTFLPFMTRLTDSIKPLLVWPALIGTYHVRALPFSLGNAPTRGQALYIVLFVILNIILTAVGYRSFQYPSNQYFTSSWQEIMAYVAARTGGLAFALAPVVILFAGRNNVLLWLTNWSHSTYMLLHRWVARVFALHVILHSILEYMLYKDKGAADLAASQKEKWWIWGIVGTIAVVVMLIVSNLYVRRFSYEIFLVVHIVMAVFVIVGSWYHVELLFERKWGYELWIYLACAVWFFDRLMRVARILKNGMRRAEVAAVTDDIVRIDIKGPRWDVRPGRHTYAYFPTLNPLRPWENHPFSVIPTALLQPRNASAATTSGPASSQHSSGSDIEKTAATTTLTPDPSMPSTTAGLTLFVRKSTGLTRALTQHSALPTLLDGPYTNNDPAAVLRTDRLLLLAGGIGITATLPFLSHHPNPKLIWTVQSSAGGLVSALSPALDCLPAADSQISIGERADVARALAAEVEAGWGRVGVVVCGPPGMCDDVRAAVAECARKGATRWELHVEAFSW